MAEETFHVKLKVDEQLVEKFSREQNLRNLEYEVDATLSELRTKMLLWGDAQLPADG
ncbi:MAG TPA: hypothetical protein VIS51_03975 [Solirubrobacterales bacterium]